MVGVQHIGATPELYYAELDEETKQFNEEVRLVTTLLSDNSQVELQFKVIWETSGVQTKGKNYIASEWNIKKFTNNRFNNIKLNENPAPIVDDRNYSFLNNNFSICWK